MKIENGYGAEIIPFGNKNPNIHPSVLLCSGVKIIGDVLIGEDSSVWFNCVLRGDVNYIKIGMRTNIQDLSMLHVTHNQYPLSVGNDVTIAHSVSLHGSTVNDCVLIGIGAVVLDGSIINSHSIVAAGSLIREGFVVPEGVLAAGVPAKIIRDLTNQEIEGIKATSLNYIRYSKQYGNHRTW